jgi:hypothetical protein
MEAASAVSRATMFIVLRLVRSRSIVIVEWETQVDLRGWTVKVCLFRRRVLGRWYRWNECGSVAM